MDPRIETLQQMQIRIARERQAADPKKADYWRQMERKAQASAVPVRAGRDK